MYRHLVAVEVGVKSGTHQRMDLNGAAVDEYRFERLNTEPVQGRGPVEQYRPFLDYFFQDVVYLGLGSFHQSPCTLDIRRQSLCYEPAHDERLEQFQGHTARQAALIQLEFGAANDYRASGVIDTLTEQVLAETSLFAAEHVGQRLQFVVAADGNSPSTPAVVHERIDSFLEHAFLVADNNFRRADIYQVAQPVVAVDDPAVQVIEVAGGEPTTVQLDHRTQVGRQDGQHRKNHPLGAVAAVAKGFDDPQLLAGLFPALSGRRLRFLQKLVADIIEFDTFNNLKNRLGTHAGLEYAAEILLKVVILVLGK